MRNTVLLIDASADRRQLLRQALERRGCEIAGEAGSLPEMIEMIADLPTVPGTVLVGARVRGTSAKRVARLLKKTWPAATVIQETAEREPVLSHAAGA